VNQWEEADALLAKVQEIVEMLKANNSDEYGLLASAHEHIMAARFDLYADLK